MTLKEKMKSGKIYYPNDPLIFNEQMKCIDLLYDYNSIRSVDNQKRSAMLKKMFAEIGDNCYIEPPFYANFGGKHCHLGKNVYANFHLTLVDDTDIFIGDYTMIGPNVTIITASHPINPDLRIKGYQYNLPVYIGKNCWLGAGVIVIPGVKIGDNSVIGAGSVVTKDIPSNVVAYGNPCRVAREINENDRLYYYKDRKINYEDIK